MVRIISVADLGFEDQRTVDDKSVDGISFSVLSEVEKESAEAYHKYQVNKLLEVPSTKFTKGRHCRSS